MASGWAYIEEPQSLKASVSLLILQELREQKGTKDLTSTEETWLFLAGKAGRGVHFRSAFGHFEGGCWHCDVGGSSAA